MNLNFHIEINDNIVSINLNITTIVHTTITNITNAYIISQNDIQIKVVNHGKGKVTKQLFDILIAWL
jgi:hypothetical protein